jgi:hypothetical protein
MKNRLPSRRRRVLLLATLPMVAGLVLVAQPDAKAGVVCGYVSASVTSVVSATVPLTTSCAPPCTGFLATSVGPNGIGPDPDVHWYACVTP